MNPYEPPSTTCLELSGKPLWVRVMTCKEWFYFGTAFNVASMAINETHDFRFWLAFVTGTFFAGLAPFMKWYKHNGYTKV